MTEKPFGFPPRAWRVDFTISESWGFSSFIVNCGFPGLSAGTGGSNMPPDPQKRPKSFFPFFLASFAALARAFPPSEPTVLSTKTYSPDVFRVL